MKVQPVEDTAFELAVNFTETHDTLTLRKEIGEGELGGVTFKLSTPLGGGGFTVEVKKPGGGWVNYSLDLTDAVRKIMERHLEKTS